MRLCSGRVEVAQPHCTLCDGSGLLSTLCDANAGVVVTTCQCRKGRELQDGIFYFQLTAAFSVLAVIALLYLAWSGVR